MAVAVVAGAVDAIAGGGGLVTVPALLLALPNPAIALATNKGQSVFGSAASLASYARAGRVDRARVVPALAGGFLGAILGVRLLLLVRPDALRPIVLAMLVASAVFFAARRPHKVVLRAPSPPRPWLAFAITLALGAYDGFFGPGVGTFLIAAGVAAFGDDLTSATSEREGRQLRLERRLAPELRDRRDDRLAPLAADGGRSSARRRARRARGAPRRRAAGPRRRRRRFARDRGEARPRSRALSSARCRARRSAYDVAVLEIGAPAPNFRGRDQHGREIALDELVRTGPVVVYFYSKDFTPICTREACAFRDAYEDFRDLGAHVVGVSADGEATHARFAATYQIPFSLVADEDGAISSAFEAFLPRVRPPQAPRERRHRSRRCRLRALVSHEMLLRAATPRTCAWPSARSRGGERGMSPVRAA